jgi:hypothetical protein
MRRETRLDGPERTVLCAYVAVSLLGHADDSEDDLDDVL